MNKVNNNQPSTDDWTIDFFDDFETFNTENWQDQRIWVNNELQCYVPNGEYGTREVSDGTLKLRVLNIGDKIECDNMDKHGVQHPHRVCCGPNCFKNRKEFIKGNGQQDLDFTLQMNLVCFQHGGY